MTRNCLVNSIFRSERRRYSSFFFISLVFLVTIVISSSQANDLKVGVARRDITPQKPLPMWGYHTRHDNLSKGTMDPLYATALVISIGTNKLGVIALDLGRTPPEEMLQEIRRKIAAKSHIQYSFIAASHTHHGPVLELSDKKGRGKNRFDSAFPYYEQLEKNILDAVFEADDRMVPAKMAMGSKQVEKLNYNRHSESRSAPVDRTLSLIRFEDLKNKPIAMLVNFAAHPTMVPLDEMRFSSDYIGTTREIVEKALSVTMVFMQGATGDLAPLDIYPKGHLGFGQKLGENILALNSTLKPKEARGGISVKEQQFRFDSRVNLDNPITRYRYGKMFFPELIANYADDYAKGIQPRLTAAILGDDIALVGVSGEFFCQHAIRLREQAPVSQLFFFGCCGGYHQYFPTTQASSEGGYGTDEISSPTALGSGEKIMESALAAIRELVAKNKQFIGSPSVVNENASATK